MKKRDLAAIFSRDDGQRSVGLQTARLCAALSKPWACPPQGVQPDTNLPQPWLSVGATGVTGLAGQIVASNFPVGVPWFAQTLKAHIAHSPNVNANAVQEALTRLAIQDVILQSVLETNHEEAIRRGRIHTSFRAAKMRATLQFLITGDCLERLNHDYSITVFPREDWVCRRKQSGDVRYWITRESVSAGDVGEEKWRQAGLGKTEKSYADTDPLCGEECDLYTLIEWQPLTAKWLIQQSLNGFVINETHEDVCPYWGTPYDLPPKGHYGHGFVEDSLGDLRTANELTLRIVEGAGQAAKLVPCIERSSELQDSDLEMPNGKTIRCRVEGGVVQDAAFLAVNKSSDFKFAADVLGAVIARLGQSMFQGSGSVRQSERTTAFEVQEVTIREVENRLGGTYSIISDFQQQPLLARALWQARADKIIPVPPKGTVDAQVLTGIAALTHARKAKDLIEYTQVAAAMGPQALERVNEGVVLKVLARYKRIDEPGVIRTDAEMEQRRQAAIKAQAAMDANKQAASTVGTMVENAHAAGLPTK